MLGHLLFVAGTIEKEALADRRPSNLHDAVNGALERGHQGLALIGGEIRAWTKQNEVRDHDFFLLFASHRVRIVFLNFVHFAFLASLYF